MDGQNIITKPDQARLVTAFETLLLFDENYQLTSNGLAESVTQDNPKQYTIKLRQGIEFQNGKTLTADDVIYSFQRIGTKANGLTGFAATATMDIAGMKKLDKYTVRLPLKTPDSTVPQTLGQLHLHHRARRLQGVPARADRHRRLQAQVVHARPAERPRAQPELLAQRPAVLRHGDDHRLQRLDRAGERAARRPDRRDDRPAGLRR